MVGVFVVAAVVGRWVVPYNAISQDLTGTLSPPLTAVDGHYHVLGTDALGRDVLSRLVEGSQISLTVALLSVGVGLFVGGTLGVLAGLGGRVADAMAMRLVDLQLAFPFVFLGMLAVGLAGRGYLPTIVVLGLWSWVIYARVVRAEILRLKTSEFIDAARALGVGRFRLFAVHMLPNMGPILVTLSVVQIGRMILAEAGLDFLSLGIQPPTPTWGSMLIDGRDYIQTAWWITLFPGLAIVAVVTGLMLLGTGLRGRLGE